MAAIPDSVRAVLEGPALGDLVTLEPDGRPQVSIVWVGLDGDEIVAAHLPEHRKIRNMRRDVPAAGRLPKRLPKLTSSHKLRPN